MTTLADISAAVTAINRLTGAPGERFHAVGNVMVPNAGHYYVERMEGIGYQLRRVTQPNASPATWADGSENVLALPPVGRSEMHRLLFAFICGLERR